MGLKHGNFLLLIPPVETRLPRDSSHSTIYSGGLAAGYYGERLSFCICSVTVPGRILHRCFGKEIYRGTWRILVILLSVRKHGNVHVETTAILGTAAVFTKHLTCLPCVLLYIKFLIRKK